MEVLSAKRLFLERPDDSLFGIEVKKSEAVDASDFKGLKVLAELAPVWEGALFACPGCTGTGRCVTLPKTTRWRR